MNLSAVIDMVPHEYDWLLRSDDSKGFFAHLMHKETFDRARPLREPQDEFASYRAFANTPEAALSAALYELLAEKAD